MREVIRELDRMTRSPATAWADGDDLDQNDDHAGAVDFNKPSLAAANVK